MKICLVTAFRNNIKTKTMKYIYFQKLIDGFEIGFFSWVLEFKKPKL